MSAISQIRVDCIHIKLASTVGEESITKGALHITSASCGIQTPQCIIKNPTSTNNNYFVFFKK